MKSIAVTSGKGGTGKSCVAAYTGIALAKAGYKTLLVELGASFRALDLILGMQEQVVFDLGDVLEDRCPVEKATLQSAEWENLFLIPGSIIPGETVDPASLAAVLGGLEDVYDYVLVDGAPFHQVPASTFHTVLQVLTPDSLCIRACAQQARELLDCGARQLRMVINNVPAQVAPMYGIRDFDDIIDQVGVQLIAVIPASPKLQYSSNNGAPLDSETITADVFARLAGRLQGKRLPLLVM